MTDEEQALKAALKQIASIKWGTPDKKPDIAVQLVLYLMEKNAHLAAALGRAIGLIDDAERESNWTTSDGGFGDSATVTLRAILASCDTRPQGGDAKQAPFTSGAVRDSADAQPF